MNVIGEPLQRKKTVRRWSRSALRTHVRPYWLDATKEIDGGRVTWESAQAAMRSSVARARERERPISSGRRPFRRKLWPQAAAFLAVMLLLPTLAFAETRLEADISPRTIGLGDRAVYSLTLTGSDSADISFPDFGELIVVGGPNQTVQSVMHFSRGQQSVRTSRVYSWTLEAPREGTFRIGPARLEAPGMEREARSVELRVEGRAQPRAQRGRTRSPLNSLFDAFDDPLGGTVLGDITAPRGESDIFLRTHVDKREVWLGEQVTLSLHLFSQADISGVQALSFPKLDGFWAEDIESPTQLYPEMQNIRGRPYRAYMLRRRALFPLRAGELVIDPVEAQINLALSLFFGAQAETVKRRSAPVTLTVKPLPAEGRPKGFEAGSVGSFRLNAEASTREVELGQPVQLTLTIEGTGNVKSVRVPHLALPSGLKTYDPTVTDNIRINRHRYGGTKSVEWVVVPERTGSFTLPSLELPFFDPSKGAYEVARTEPIPIEVHAPDPGAMAFDPRPGEASEPVAANTLSSGVRPIRVNASLVSRRTTPVWSRSWFWPVATAPVVAFALWAAGGLAVGAIRRRDPEKLREKRARGEAGRRLKDARHLLESGDVAGLHAEVSRALMDFVADRCGVVARGLTRDELEARLLSSGHSPGPVRALSRVLDRCDAARFSPAAGDPAKLAELVDEAERIIDALDGSAEKRRSA